MKVTISQDGVMSVSPEDGVEAFALNAWVERNYVGIKEHQLGAPHWLSSGLMVTCRVFKIDEDKAK